MTAPNWTPGPWTVHPFRETALNEFYGDGVDGEAVFLSGPDGKPILASQDYENYGSSVKVRCAADARLIASAPALAAALERVLFDVEAYLRDEIENPISTDAEEAARSALARARGEG